MEATDPCQKRQRTLEAFVKCLLGSFLLRFQDDNPAYEIKNPEDA
jgi:hypothetical protein